jgi:hypothetical protein
MEWSGRTNPLTRERAAREVIAWTERRSAAQGASCPMTVGLT